jgi:acetyl-CoA acetyltransferase family protein
MSDALIVDALRTPIGRRNGALAGVRAEELAAQTLNGLVGRLDLDPGEIEDVQMGCVSQVGEQALNVARMSLLVAGWPETVCGTSVDRQCGSSMQTAFNAASAVQAGHLDVVVASGVESMSRVPMGSNLTANGFEGFSPKLYEHWEVVPQGISAEVIADEWDLSREALDEYSYESHRRAIAAIDEGRFEREIVPVEVGAGGAAVLVATDENPRRDTSLEKLASLQPAFKEGGKITAGNSSAIVDGAAAMLVLEGDAGIGKSTLWQAAVEAARGRGLVVLASRPAEAERVLVHAGLCDLLEHVADEALPLLSAPKTRRASASLGRADSTRSPAARASATQASQSVVLPIPGQPVRTSAAAPSRRAKAPSAASSRSRPTTPETGGAPPAVLRGARRLPLSPGPGRCTSTRRRSVPHGGRAPRRAWP